MKLVLSAWIGSHNLGDEAIAAVVIDMLERTAEVESLTVLSINPPKTQRLVAKRSTRVVQASFGNYIRALRRSDALLLGGGGIIQDESSALNLLFYYLESWVAKHILHKPVFWIFVGVGPIRTRLGRRLLRAMRTLTERALVRDAESAALLRQHGFADEQIIVAYDVVFNFPLPKAAGPQSARDYLLFCPRDWFFVSAILPTRFALKRARRHQGSRLQIYRRHMVELVERVLRDNQQLTIQGVAFFYSQDLNLLAAIHAQLPADIADRFVVETNELSPAEFLHRARSAAAVFGIRLHSLILGAVAGAPLVPLTYSAKVENLAKYLGLEAVTTKLARPDFAIEPVAQNIQRALGAKPVTTTRQIATIRTRNEAAYAELLAAIRASLAA